jgi:regulator of protease activity HflC (stomatin/prohibitin superfamily)
MLTSAIAITLIFLALMGFLVSRCYVSTPAGTLTIIKNFGGKPQKILEPGIGWMLWPYQQIHSKVKIRKQTENIPIEANCLLNALTESEATIETDSIISVKSPSVSINFTLELKPKSNLEEFFRVVEIDKDGNIDYKTLLEKMSDAIRVSAMESLEKIGFMEAALSKKETGEAATDAVKALIVREHLPIEKESVLVVIDKPFWPTDAELAKAFQQKPLEALKLAAAHQDMERKIFEAQKGVEVAKFNAETTIIQKSAELRAIMEAAGPNLSDDERRAFLITLTQLETLREMKGSTVILPGNLLDAINGIIGKFGGR